MPVHRLGIASLRGRDAALGFELSQMGADRFACRPVQGSRIPGIDARDTFGASARSLLECGEDLVFAILTMRDVFADLGLAVSDQWAVCGVDGARLFREQSIE